MRDQALTAAQRRHRFIQERANFVLWQMKQRNPDTTDEVQHGHHEGGESEVATDDEEPGASTPATGLTRLLSVLRGEQNAALAKEAFSDASQIQHAILAVLGATSGDEPAGFTIPLANEIRNIFQRLFRSARNRGEDERATSYRRYVDDFAWTPRTGIYVIWNAAQRSYAPCAEEECKRVSCPPMPRMTRTNRDAKCS